MNAHAAAARAIRRRNARLSMGPHEYRQADQADAYDLPTRPAYGVQYAHPQGQQQRCHHLPSRHVSPSVMRASRMQAITSPHDGSDKGPAVYWRPDNGICGLYPLDVRLPGLGPHPRSAGTLDALTGPVFVVNHQTTQARVLVLSHASPFVVSARPSM